MSGGSWDYLYCKDLGELLNRQSDLQAMADRLVELGYAPDAAAETQELLQTIKQFENRCQVMMHRLSGIWHAIEWLDSCDHGPEQVRKAVEEYQKGIKP